MKQLIKSETVRGKLDMPRSTFERHVKLRTNSLPSPIYIGRSRFFDAAEIDAWIAGFTSHPANDA